MLNKAVRMHGQNDLRLDTFELPEIKDNEILVKVISDSICMSSYKAAIQGSNHKRVPADIAEHPVIVGHEFCGVIEQVGAKWADKFTPGEKLTIQPNISYRGTMQTPGYAFEFCGGDTQYAVLLPELMEQDCVLPYHADEFFYGSLSEPLSCIIGTFHAMYHTTPNVYVHDMGIREGGNLAILAGAGPMGLGAIDYAIHCDRKPGLLVVTDIDQARLDRAASIYTTEEAEKNGVKLVYCNTKENAVEKLMALTDGKGYDDVMVFAPVTNTQLSANFNFYNVHYAAHHLVGTSGGSTEDMREALRMISEGKLRPAGMITHVGGLNAVAETTCNLPKIPGGKKLVYTNIDLPLTNIDDFAKVGETDPLFAKLAEICARHNNLWNGEAEQYLLAHAKAI